MKTRTILTVLAYIAAITLANLLVARYGPAITIINAFFLIGLDLALRDYLHDVWSDRRAIKMLSLIGSAGIVSYAINPAAGRIAIASLAAFAIAATIDWLVYHLLRNRSWMIRSNGSNIAGAGVDSFLFPLLAFGWPLMPVIILGQFVAKVFGGLIWSSLIGGIRVAARNHRAS